MSEFYDQLGNLDHLAVGNTATLGDPWHGNGAFDGAVPLEAAQRVLRLNVEVVPTYIVDIDQPMGFRQLTNVDKKTGKEQNLYAVMDADTGHCFQSGVTDTYKAPNYDELFEYVALLMDVGQGEYEIGSAMALGHKQKAMIQVRPTDGLVIGGDHILPWIAAASSVDSSWATTLKQCITRLECDNTAAMIMGEKTPTYKFKATKNARFDVREAQKALGVFRETIDAMVEQIATFQETNVSDRQFKMIIDKLVPMTKDGQPVDGKTKTIRENERDRLARMWTKDPRVSQFRGTAWGVVQAVSTATIHESTVRLNTGKGMTRTDRQAEHTIDGTLDKVNAATIQAINEVFAAMGQDALATV